MAVLLGPLSVRFLSGTTLVTWNVCQLSSLINLLQTSLPSGPTSDRSTKTGRAPLYFGYSAFDSVGESLSTTCRLSHFSVILPLEHEGCFAGGSAWLGGVLAATGGWCMDVPPGSVSLGVRLPNRGMCSSSRHYRHSDVTR